MTKRLDRLKTPLVFDLKVYDELNAARGAIVSSLIAELGGPVGLRTAVDVGCGAGYFSGLLKSLGLEVTGVDGRPQNVEVSKHRQPGVRFERYDAEDPALRVLGRFDLVLCFGLLYHLENPLLAMRHLHALTGKLLLVEVVVFPGEEPTMALVDEGAGDDQGLNYVAFYPTEACLQKMLYRAGFLHVYKLAVMPNHPGYRKSRRLPQVRTMLAASQEAISSHSLKQVPEPSVCVAPWDARSVAAYKNSFEKLRRFAKRPIQQKIESIERLIKKRGWLRGD